MTYGFAISQQLELFLYSLGFGFLLGLLYRIIMTVRKEISRKKAAFVAFDLIFSVTATILTFCFFLVFTDGQIRLISLFADAVGFAVYLFSADLIMKKLISYPVKLVISLVKLLLLPLNSVIRLTKKTLKLIKEKIASKKLNQEEKNGTKKIRLKKPNFKRRKIK